MTTRAVAEIDDWDTVPFGGGYAGLRELADAGFSGVVQAGPAKLCLLNGTPLGVLDGTVDDFEDAAGTAYEAPSPALPLLALMQARGDEVRAEYYSEDTPISEVDRTLSEGGFSGYIELSENVLSGDYYVVYHAGRSMAVAWVGNVGELLTDDEAFQRADDEVGIYQVRQVDIEPVEIPGSSGGSSAGAAGTGAGTASAGATGAAAAGGTDDTGSSDDPASETGETGRTEVTGTTGTARTESSTETAGAAESGGTPGTAGTDEPGVDGSESDVDESEATVADASATEAGSAQSVDDATNEPADAEATEVSAASPTRTEPDAVETGRTDSSESTESTATGQTESTESTASTGQTESTESTASTGQTESTGIDRVRERDSASQRPGAGAGEASDGRADEGSPDGRDDAEDATAAPARRLETRSIPSLDPERTSDDRETDAAAAGATGGAGAATDTGSTERSGADESRSADDRQSRSASRPQSDAETDSGADAEPAPTSTTESSTDTGPEPTGDASSEPAEASAADDQAGSSTADGVASDSSPSSTGTAPEAASERVAALEAEIEEHVAKRERLESELATVRSERDDLQRDRDDLQRERDELREARNTLQTERDRLASERDELAAEVDRLESETERLRSELDELKAEFGGALDSERQLSPSEALAGTNLFVRYESKGKATLESAHGGNASREDVAENLDLEHHTQFEAENASVGGQPFEAFLRETLQYRFVDWVVSDLVYEIRDTGKVAALQDLYDAIPNVDRAELGGTVTVEFTEDGQEKEAEESFDVVLRDRMGTPLVVANLSDSRDAVTEGMMSSLVTASSRVSESNDSLAAAIFVTSSFFEPEALETAAASTGHGRFSRDKRESFVKHSRNRGYHLCLAEARDSQFHLTVPDL